MDRDVGDIGAEMLAVLRQRLGHFAARDDHPRVRPIEPELGALEQTLEHDQPDGLVCERERLTEDREPGVIDDEVRLGMPQVVDQRRELRNRHPLRV